MVLSVVLHNLTSRWLTIASGKANSKCEVETEVRLLMSGRAQSPRQTSTVCTALRSHLIASESCKSFPTEHVMYVPCD